MSKFYSKEDEYKAVLKSGEATDKLIYKEFVPEETRAVDDQNLTIDFTISSSSIDRMHDVIDQNGWDLKSFKKNPVVLWAHDQGQPPVAKAISRSLKVDGKKLIATAQFMPADVSEFSYMIFQMYKLGFMNATSVGFRPLEWSFAEDDKRPYGVNFTKQELLEFSCVPVPANADALMGAKSMGVNTRPLKSWVEGALDNWKEEGDLLVPRSSLESLYKSLSARAKLLKPIEEAMTTENTEDKKVETETKEVLVEEKVAETTAETPVVVEKTGAESSPAIQEAHALHRSALNLSRHAAAMHRKANTMLQKVFDPDGAQDGDGTDYAPNEKALSELEGILKTFEVDEVSEDDKTELKITVDASPVMEMIKQLQLNVISLQTQLHANREAEKTVETKEVETEVKKTEEVPKVKEDTEVEYSITLFEDSVDTDEDSVNVEEVKELLQSLDFANLIEESLKKNLGSKV